MTVTSILLLISLCIVVTLATIVLWYFKTSKEQDTRKIPQIGNRKYSFIDIKSEPHFKREMLEYWHQSPEWRNGMKRFGHNLKNHGVEAIYFVHGTFVGHDPFGLIEFFQVPKISKRLDKTVRNILKASTNQLLKDTGNFTKEYVDLAREALDLPTYDFCWSSANHHYARVKGLVELIDRLGQDIQNKTLTPSSRIVLVGHSHAGQIFSLLSRLANQKDHNTIQCYIDRSFPRSESIEAKIAQLQNLNFRYVTLGTPPRYTWGHNEGELLQLVNHTKQNLSMPGVKGIATIDYGDYIQKLGQPGSDIVAPLKEERIANKELDGILGIGKDHKTLRRNLEKSFRPIGEGYTIFVDFQKNLPQSYRNSFASIFGHGVYTRYDKMYLLFLLIDQHFISQNNQ